MLWVGTRNSGIFKWSEDSARYIAVSISEGNLENSINDIEFSSGHLYIATERGVCRLDTDTDSIEWFTIGNSDLPYNKVNHLELTADGTIWVATAGNRVTCFVNDSLISHMIPQINGVLNIRAVMPDTSGSIWIATNGNGIFRINGDSIENITTAGGLASDFCYSMEFDNHGHVWVSHRGSLSRIEGEAGLISTFAEESGIPSDMIFNQNASDKDKEGILWFGTSAGIVSFDPRFEKGITPAPALSIRSVLVNNQPVNLDPGLVLGPGRYDLQIQFIGVSLKNPKAVTYQYKMEGLGNRWSDFFDQDYVLFNSLAHGRYQFMVRAMNQEGLIGEQPAVVDVLIRKPLWKQWWFIILELLMAFMVTAGIVKRREYQLRREKEILEQAVRERTEEVVKQKDKIEKQRDAIEIQKNEIEYINRNINDSMVYGSRIQNAVFPPLRLLDELFPDHFLFFKPHQIVSGDFFWVSKSDGKHIVTVADCTGHGVPGAFMSMLGITYLNELVHTTGILEADQILNYLKSDIIKALRQDESEIISGDGMDMVLCIYDPGSSTLQYAGGFNPLILVRDGEINLIKADPMPVGLGALKEKKFKSHNLKIQRGDLIYLTSDGYMDQFGGERGKKFTRRRFLDMLLEIHADPMEIQKQIIASRLEEWMGEEEQIDDITVLGIRF
jgi:serine phosphatase RsbU (regulator of sigma subunit)